MADDYSITFYGLEELRDKMERAIEVYPDVSIMTVKKCGSKLRKMAVEQTDAAGVGTLTGNLRKGYRFSTVGWGMDVRGEFKAETRRNPHLHLIEHGHNVRPRGPTQVKHSSEDDARRNKYEGGGKSSVQAYHMIENAKNLYEPVHKELAEEAMSKILRKAKLK